MKRVFIGLLSVFLITLFTQHLSHAKESMLEKIYHLGKVGNLKLKIPMDWNEKFVKRSNDTFPRIELTPSQRMAGKVVFTVMWKLKGMTNFDSTKELKLFLVDSGNKLLNRAEEKKIKLLEFKGKHSLGYYYVLTDKKPAPGEYKVLVQGAIRVGKLALLFSILSNECNGKTFKNAIKILAYAEYQY